MTPILVYFDFSIFQLNTDYWSIRFVCLFFYIVFNLLINIFPLLDNFLFFISDGVILSQVTCMYLVNETSMTCLLSILPVLFVLMNHHIIRGINNFEKDEKKEKVSFVRLVGKHDASFLFIMQSLFVFLLNLLDFTSVNYMIGCNLWYLIYVIYAFGKIMEGKKINSLRTYSKFIVFIYIAIYMTTITFLDQPFPDRTYPLYVPKAYDDTFNPWY